MTGATSAFPVRSQRRTLDSSLSSLDQRDKPDWLRLGALVFMHAGSLAVLWVGWSWTAVGLAAMLYFCRAFGLTGFYHRYFSHKTFHTSRAAQFIFAVMGATAVPPPTAAHSAAVAPAFPLFECGQIPRAVYGPFPAEGGCSPGPLALGIRALFLPSSSSSSE